ncbi:MAG: FAD-dependent oxidoreductase [Chloroflexi bacterium]|nr:FAD-dependent oxidoreductase [Chloroflexota bacterium]
MPEQYDVIIVGGGSAGCAMAMRLSEDPRRQVLLLEAGHDPQPIPEIVADAGQQTRLLLESPYLLMYPTQRTVDGSTFYNLAGRIMGGGSSVNVMSILRPTKHDLDSWVAHGNPDWSYEKLLPVMKRIESDQDYPESPIHGADGPLHIVRPFTWDKPMSDPVRAFVERAFAMGLPRCEDINGPAPFGVAGAPYNIKNGRRQSTTVAYLELARGRSNLHIVAEALVHRLEVSGRRVTGVRYERDGEIETVSGAEVVLSAGCYHSPHILMLSGIGPAKELERHGIPAVNALEGVGQNLQDHAGVTMTFDGPSEFREDWVVPRFRLVYKSDPDLPCGNFHIMMRPPTDVAGLKRMMPVMAYLLEQHNRGRVKLASVDPHELPIIEAGMLDHPDDVEAMRTAMQFMIDLVQDDTMKDYYGALFQPGPKEDWVHFARSTFGSYHHGSGTCLMAPADNPMAVVDQQLRVYGMDNLRVADASIMPTVSHANTNLTCIMIGERASDLIISAR